MFCSRAFLYCLPFSAETFCIDLSEIRLFFRRVRVVLITPKCFYKVLFAKDIMMDEESDSSYKESLSSDSYDEDERSGSEDSGDSLKRPFSEEEIEELIDDLLKAESEAAKAQEILEEESLQKIENDIRAELSASCTGSQLEDAVRKELETFKDKWEFYLQDLEDEIAVLQEQIDGAGVNLAALYKWIEKQTPEGCTTDTWKKRVHWSGSHISDEVRNYINEAECDLLEHKPVRSNHGKLLEEEASGYLGKKLTIVPDPDTNANDRDWSLMNTFIDAENGACKEKPLASNKWASVYLASTPKEAADLGLNFPGVNKIEEIVDIKNYVEHPFYAAAFANENAWHTEEQKCKLRKVREEDDIKKTQKLNRRLKKRRKSHKRYRSEKYHIQEHEGFHEKSNESTFKEAIKVNVETSSSYKKRKRMNEDIQSNDNMTEAVILESDEDHRDAQNKDLKNEGVILKSGNNFSCTACGHDLNAARVCRHPLLGVVVCKTCKSSYEDCLFEKDSDGSESFCRWCSKGGRLICCDQCEKVFCEECITHNFGETRFKEICNTDWYCFSCSPQSLSFLVDEYNKAATVLKNRISDSEAGYNHVVISPFQFGESSKARRIKPIIDDADLTEETKEKIAVEQERQNRLQMLHKQSTGLCKSVDLTSNCWITTEFNQSKGYGNAAEGFIVNIARESNEDIIRIPPSVSVCLKPHQVSGIQFMWENCIQSINQVKSGDKGLGCILAHSMGLGKTLQVITFLYIIFRKVDVGLKTALIVTPVNVLHNWKREFVKWRPLDLASLPIFILDDTSREYIKRVKILKKWMKKGGVLLISYSTFRNLSQGKHVKEKSIASDIRTSLQDGPDILICDEAHIIKNRKADVTQALKQVKTQRKIALTGSPLQNNLMEYYCMVDFVREGFLGTPHEFRNRFQNPIENGQHANSTIEDVKLMNQRSHVLYEQLKGFVQRMDMNTMKNNLPPKSVFVMSVKLSPLQQEFYKKFLKARGLTNKKINPSGKGKKGSFFSAYHSLAKICNHPSLVLMSKEDTDTSSGDEAIENTLGFIMSSEDEVETDGGDDTKQKVGGGVRMTDNDAADEGLDKWWQDILPDGYQAKPEDSGKMMLLLDILKMSSEVGDKVLVFSQSLNTLDLIESFLTTLPHPRKGNKLWRRGKEWYRLDGSTNGSQRQKLLEEFNEPSNKTVQCILISTRAGALGINLPAANRVIIVDGSWNPTHDLQALYRAWRIGQTKHVYAYRLVAHGTMEEKVYKRQVAKEGLAARVVDKQVVYRTMKKEEIVCLFGLEDGASSDDFSELIFDENIPTPVATNKNTSVNELDSAADDGSFMCRLMNQHHPRWMVNYHEHEALLQENEDEKLSKEEQAIAWENYKMYVESESTKPPIESSKILEHMKQSSSKISEPIKPLIESSNVAEGIQSATGIFDSVRALESASQSQQQVNQQETSSQVRKCGSSEHAVELYKQNIKVGKTFFCNKCQKEVGWEDFQKKSRR